MGAFSASMAPAASRALQARQSSWQRPRRLRWVVECTLAWLHRFRRLALRYERRADLHEAFLTRLRPYHLALPKEGVLKRTLKNISMGNEAKLQFRAEVFNVTNTANFAPPTAVLGGANCGQLTQMTAGYAPLEVQFAIRFQF